MQRTGFREETPEFDPETFDKTEKRLDLLKPPEIQIRSHSGRSALLYREAQEERLEKLMNYDAYLETLKQEMEQAEEKLPHPCKRVGDPQAPAKSAGKENDGGAARSEFHGSKVSDPDRFRSEKAGEKGYDEVEFLISTNPGKRAKAAGAALPAEGAVPYHAGTENRNGGKRCHFHSDF